MSRYFLVPHLVPATCRSRAPTSMRGDSSPSNAIGTEEKGFKTFPFDTGPLRRVSCRAMDKRFSVAMMVALAVSACGGGIQNVPGEEVAARTGVKWKDMTAIERRHFDQFVNREKSPCGNTTIAYESLDPKRCPLVVNAARFASKRLMGDDTPDELRIAYLKRYGAGYTADINVSSAPRLGPENAPVKIVIFSDFQCPFCAAAVRSLKEVKQTYGDDVALYFKHYPLAIHELAKQFALVAEAAVRQGCFWPFHDLLFENQAASLSLDQVKELGTKAGCDAEKLMTDYGRAETRAAVDADMAEAEKLNIPGTPSLFVNGRYVDDGTKSLGSWIDEELVRQGRKAQTAP